MFKDKLRELRKNANYTQEELASKLYVSRSAVAKWEQGKGFPNEKSLEDICELFSVTKDELYNDLDVIETIGIVEKEYRTLNKRFLFLIILLILLVLVASIFSIIYFTNRNKEDYVFDKMISEDYLKECHLPGLKQLDGKDKVLFYDNIYDCNIDNKNEFDDYVKYVYNYLKTSPHISGLRCKVEKPLKDDTEINKIYLMVGEELSDFNMQNSFGDYYTFYYFFDLDDNRKIGDEINYYCLNLHYSYVEDKIHNPNSPFKLTNFRFSVVKTDPTSDDSYYLLEEYYNINKIILTNANIDNYINYNSTNLDSKFMVDYKNNCIYKMNWWIDAIDYYIIRNINLNITVEVFYKENNEIKQKVITKVVNYNKEQSLIFSMSDCGIDDINNIVAYDVKILDVEVIDNSKLIWCSRRDAYEK